MKKWEQLANKLEQEIREHDRCRWSATHLEGCTLNDGLLAIIKRFKTDQLSKGSGAAAETN